MKKHAYFFLFLLTITYAKTSYAFLTTDCQMVNEWEVTSTPEHKRWKYEMCGGWATYECIIIMKESGELIIRVQRPDGVRLVARDGDEFLGMCRRALQRLPDKNLMERVLSDLQQ